MVQDSERLGDGAGVSPLGGAGMRLQAGKGSGLARVGSG